MTLAELSETYAAGRRALDEVSAGLVGIGVDMAPQIALGLLCLRQIGKPVPLHVWHHLSPSLGKTANYAAVFLTDRGLARRLGSTDKRVKPIEITDQGRALLDRLEERLAGRRQDIAA